MDLSTKYLGLDLPHPFMPGASPMVEDMDTVRRLEHRLGSHKRLGRDDICYWIPELLQRPYGALSVFETPEVANGDRHDWFAMHLFRQERCRWGLTQVQKTAKLIGSASGELAKEPYHLASLFHRVDHHPGRNLRSDRIGLVLEGSDDAEVAPTST